MKKFVIFAFPRSGSTYLCSRLNAHPQIRCHYEVFHPAEIVTDGKPGIDIPELAGFTPRTRDEDPARFLKALFSHDRGQQATGFKIFIGHSEQAHRLILADRSIAKILLRRSTVDAFISMTIAEQAGEYTSTSATPTSTKVEIKAGGLLNFDGLITRYFAEIEQALRLSGQAFLTVQYKELIASDDALQRILAFIGVEPVASELTPFTVRQNSEAVADKVSNIEQVLEDLVRLYREKP